MKLHCSIAHERQHFLRKLSKNPIFLLQHVPAFIGFLRLRHQRTRNRSMRPSWLPKHLLAHSISASNAQDIWQRIPERLLVSDPISSILLVSDPITFEMDCDREEYLAQHRFAELFLPPTSPIAALPSTIEMWLCNPPHKETPAWEPYSCCERVCNLLTWISFIPKQLRAEVLAKQQTAMIQLLNTSLHHIYEHLEYYGKPTNNHILNNARALILCGIALQHAQGVDCGLRLLQNLLPHLIQKDGMLRERSTHYQLIVLNWLLDTEWFLSAHKPSSQLQWLHATIVRMAQAAAHLCDEDGFLMIYFGDISPDATPVDTAMRLRGCYPQQWPIQANKIKTKIKIMDSSDEMHIHQCDDFYFLKKNSQQIMVSHHAGVYPQPHPTHAHNDLTSFIWMVDQQPVLIDCGRSRYTKDDISTQQKSACGHNSVFVNHFAPCCESLVICGHWHPRPYANAWITIEADPAKSSLMITHDGFKRATPVAKHIRTITLNEKNHLQIKDEFISREDASSRVQIMLLWHLHPSLHAVSQNIFANDQLRMRIMSDSAQIISEHSVHAWQYGAIDQHLILMLKWEVTLPFVAITTFQVERHSCVA